MQNNYSESGVMLKPGSTLRGWSPALCVPSFKNLEGVLTILCALTQKRIVLNSIVLFWVSAQSIVKAPSKFLKLRFSEQVTSLLVSKIAL